MKERPILFSGPMVRALLDGNKTQTRRVVKLPSIIAAEPDGESAAELNGLTTVEWLPEHEGGPGFYGWMTEHPEEGSIPMRHPYGQPGDRLWVRETWAHARHAAAANCVEDGPFVYAADGEFAARERLNPRWVPGIHMFRWASRITLEITAVRVERLQDISTEDCIAEGIDRSPSLALPGHHVWCDYRLPHDRAEWFSSPVCSYRTLWEEINGPGSWDANPWVWVVEFRRVTP